jgi:hypothetical protein
METNARTYSASRRPDDRGKISAANRDPYSRLAAAILGQAAKEARAGDQDAAIWLLSEQAEFLAGAVGLSWTHVQKWARPRAR